jgi:hypothetical protein
MVASNSDPSAHLRIVILEDNLDRQGAFRDVLSDRFPMFELRFAVTSGECVRLIDEAYDRIAIVALDNDLDVLRTSFGTAVDAGTGVEVAEYLARRQPAFPVVIHTTNTAAGDKIESLLGRNGWPHSRVVPYGDLEWIPAEWFRAVRNRIVEHSPLLDAAPAISTRG